MQTFLGSWNIGKKIKEIIEIKDAVWVNGKLSGKHQEDIQRAKNFQRYKEDHADAEKADKKVKETGYL
jgi:hypothetical protein